MSRQARSGKRSRTRSDLAGPLRDPVLAEEVETGGRGAEDQLGRVPLRHREERDVFRIPASPPRGGGDARKDIFTPPAQLVRGGEVGQNREDFSLASAPRLASRSARVFFSRGMWVIAKLRKPLRPQDRFGEERLQVLGSHLEVAVHLLDEQHAVGADLDLVGAGVLGALEREEKRPVLRDVVGGVSERLPELEHRTAMLRLDIDARARGTGIAPRGAVDRSPEFHRA